MPSLDKINAAIHEALGERAPEVVRHKGNSADRATYYLTGPSVEPLIGERTDRWAPRGVMAYRSGSDAISAWVEAAEAAVARADNVLARAALDEAHGAHEAEAGNCPGCERAAAEVARVAALDDWRVSRLIEKAEGIAEAYRYQTEGIERAIEAYRRDPVARQGSAGGHTGTPSAVWFADALLSVIDNNNVRGTGLAHAALLAAEAVEGSINDRE